ncbi:MAG: AAA family ATPase [Deltaproteobacteria bacterium]|nr:AAA family ATPase [Deltaproteobacteria bacterium]
MLTWLRLRNWRGFAADAEGFPLGRLTAVVGENSAGKSTILRALVILAQSHAGRALPTSLITIGPRGEFGMAQGLVHGFTAGVSSSASTGDGLDDRNDDPIVRMALQTVSAEATSTAEIAAMRSGNWLVEYGWRVEPTAPAGTLAEIRFSLPDTWYGLTFRQVPTEHGDELGLPANSQTAAPPFEYRLDNDELVEELADADPAELPPRLHPWAELAKELRDIFVPRALPEPVAQDDEDAQTVAAESDGPRADRLADLASLRMRDSDGQVEFSCDLTGREDLRADQAGFPQTRSWQDFVEASGGAKRPGPAANEGATAPAFDAWQALVSLRAALQGTRDACLALADLGPMRIAGARVHPRDRTDRKLVRVGRDGEHVADILLHHGYLHGYINRILRDRLKLVRALSSDPVGKPKVMLELSVAAGGATDVNMADVGVGVSQALPLAVLLALTERRPDAKDMLPVVLAVEQPELHLHPTTQAVLAQIFLEHLGLAPANPKMGDESHEAPGAGADRPLTWPQLLVETHSPQMLAAWTGDLARPITDICVLQVLRKPDGSTRVLVR